MEEKYIISVIGLGKLGIPTALSFAKAGFEVLGVDVDKNKLAKLKNGISPIYEPNVQEYLNKYMNKLTFTNDIREVVLKSDVAFVIVPTPSEADGTFSLKFVIPVIEEIATMLKDRKEFFITTIVSTITPMSMDEYIKPQIENLSGKKCGIDFGLCYNPEFVALGSVLSDFENPPFVLIGESDKRSGDILEYLYKKVCKNNPQIMRMNFINAEITKLALNTYITTKITYANMLARICERLAMADVDVVTSALGLDPRIGNKYLKGGLGYGGPCFPRDNKALSSFCKKIGLDIILPDTIDAFNRNQPQHIVDIVKKYLVNKDEIVGIMGITYKPETDVIEESQGLKVAQILRCDGIECLVFDKIPMENLPSDVKKVDNFEEFAKYSKVIILAVAYNEFKNLIVNNMNLFEESGKVIIDCWRFLKEVKFPRGVTYIKLGSGKIF